MNKSNDFKFNLPGYTDAVDVEDFNDNFRGIDDALMAGLCKKDYTGNNMGSSDPSARKYAWAPWLEIVNDNEFDVVVTDRNAPVGSEEATINIAAGQTFRKYINGRYYMNFYVQDQHDVTFKWFTNAETYINESGGGGGGTGTVTSVSVQGGSGSHLTASGNPIETSGTITIDIDDGYSIPSDNEQTAWDGKAADLKAEIDSSTYVLTLQLKDSAGNLIGNERTIDLPLETMVVDGEYDSQTQKIKLELKNGNYVEFSVADLVSGLQTELSASNKLDPDYIDYDASHRAVSDTEKTTWNGKQNAISDLETIRSGAAAGATAVQPSAMQTALATKQDSLSETQLAAVNSGINSTKVAQIETNKTNILYALKTGVINLLDVANVKSGWSGITVTGNDDGTVKATGTATGESAIRIHQPLTLEAGTYYFYRNLQDGSTGGTIQFFKNNSYAANITSNNAYIFTLDSATTVEFKVYFANTAQINATFKPMVIDKAVYDAGVTEWQPYALPNYDLTYLQAQDRAELVELVDSGAKNELQPSWTTQTINGVTFTVGSDGIITAATTGSRTSAAIYPLLSRYSGTKMTGKVMSISPKGGSNASYYVAAEQADSPWHNVGTDYGDGVVISSEANNKDINVNIVIPANYSPNNLKFSPMICTKAAFGVSQKFVPYRPNYDFVLSKLLWTPINVPQNGNDNYFGVIITGPKRGTYNINFMSNNGINGYGNIIISTIYTNDTWNVYVNTNASANVTMKVYSISSTSLAIVFYAPNKWAGFTISGTDSNEQTTIYRSSNAPSWTEITQQAFPT